MRNMTLAGAIVGLGLLSLLVPWSSASGSSAATTVDTLPVEDDATRVETRHWRGEGGQEVPLVIVRGGGHTLPHPTAAFPAEIVGRTSRDLDAARAIWNFFVDVCGRSDGQSALRSMR